MKIIDNIKDFDKIKVGYTLKFQNINRDVFKEIILVNYQLRSIEVKDFKQSQSTNTIINIFQISGIEDIIFPCSPEDVPKYFPEYFI